MDEEHPQRIHLDSIQNWTAIRHAIVEQLDSCLEGALEARGASHVRDAAKLHLDQWLESLLESAKDSVLINGQTVDDSLADSQRTEPFDEVLNSRLWELSNDRIYHSTLVANERRNKPNQVELLMADLLKRQHEASLDSAALEALEPLANPYVDRPVAAHDEAQQHLTTTIAVALDLEQSLPQLIERTQRAKEISDLVSQKLTSKE